MAFNMAVGMAEKCEVGYSLSPDGDEMQALIGSTAVYVSSEGDRDPCITFRAFLAHDVPLVEGEELALYQWVNQRNMESRFGRFVLIEGRNSDSAPRTADLGLEFEILAEKVQKEEFMHSLVMMWRMADRFDDEAVAAFGGRTHEDALATGSGGDNAAEAQRAAEEEVDA